MAASKRILRPLIAILILGAIASGLVLWQTAVFARQYALNTINERASQTLSLVVENLRGELAKFRYLPRLLAAKPEFVAAVLRTPTPQERDELNRELERVTLMTGALDAYIMDQSGTTVAASNYDSGHSFIGQNFAYRPYFRQALTGSLGRYFALGTTSRERGYYFAYPLSDGASMRGTVVVKLRVGAFENAWRTSGHEILVVDDDGVVFLSNRPGWHFKTLKPLDAETRRRLQQSRKYHDQALDVLPIHKRRPWGGVGELITLQPERDTTGGTSPSRTYLALNEPMADAGWRVFILADTGAVGGEVATVVTVVSLMLASLLLAATAVYLRRRQLAERMAMQERSKTELEARVRDRTEELTETNARLRAEVNERQKTEDELRQTQADLVQAAKLAALGQMSAGLSHELNQPLAAIRSYSDNASSFLERGNDVQVRENLLSISGLTERMARIIRHLRTYARKAPTELRPTNVNSALDEALALLDQRITKEGVKINVCVADSSLVATGGDVRLQQVLVNLISNALDAVSTAPEKSVTINIERSEDDKVRIVVRDSGPGIPPNDLPNVFDPFFTSKDVGKGLGLGLSITYGIIKQFGGEVTAANHPDGGAEFTVMLKAAACAQGEAA